MAQDTMKIRIRVGRSAGQFNAGDTRAAEFFSDAVAREALGTQRDSNYVQLKNLQGMLTREVNTELANAVRYAADRMIGQQSQTGQMKTFSIEPGGAIPGLSSQGIGARMRNGPMAGRHEVQWKQLSPRTIEQKGNNRFFDDTGALRRELKRNAASIAAATGGIKFDVFRNGQYQAVSRKTNYIRIAQLRMTFLPRVHRGFLPGLHSGNLLAADRTMRFESLLGLSNSAWEKLRGPQTASGFARPEWNRPLLQPVFSYWTMFRLPRRVASVMDRIITQRTTGQGAGYRGI